MAYYDCGNWLWQLTGYCDFYGDLLWLWWLWLWWLWLWWLTMIMVTYSEYGDLLSLWWLTMIVVTYYDCGDYLWLWHLTITFRRTYCDCCDVPTCQTLVTDCTLMTVWGQGPSRHCQRHHNVTVCSVADCQHQPCWWHLRLPVWHVPDDRFSTLQKKQALLHVYTYRRAMETNVILCNMGMYNNAQWCWIKCLAMIVELATRKLWQTYIQNPYTCTA